LDVRAWGNRIFEFVRAVTVDIVLRRLHPHLLGKQHIVS